MRRRPHVARVYLQDILSAIARIEDYTGAGKRAFLVDVKTQDATLRQISIIGEAAAKVPPSMKANYPGIPWKAITGMRNVVIHEYSDVRMERVWETVERDLPKLKATVEDMIGGL